MLSCTSTQQEAGHQQDSTNLPSGYKEILPEITTEQQTAFDALNTLQMQMQAQYLYSTFPGLGHACFPADSSFVISRAELLTVIEALLAKHCTDLSLEERSRLAAQAVMAQKEYSVEWCFGTSPLLVDGVLTEVPIKTSSSGTWILPRVLGQRDVILEWD